MADEFIGSVPEMNGIFEAPSNNLQGVSGDTFERIVQLARAADGRLIADADAAADDNNVLVVRHRDDETVSKINFDEYRTNPRRAKSTVTVYDSPSFIAYVKRFQTPATILFADAESVTGILNYHTPVQQPRSVNDPAAAFMLETPGWGDHQVTLTLKQTDQWKQWFTASKQSYIEAGDWALFIENHIGDIVQPDHGKLVDLARNLKLSSTQEYESHTAVGNGATKFRYVQNESAKTDKHDFNVVDGEQITIAVPMYEGGQKIAISGRISYRLREVSGRKILVFKLELFGADEAERIAVQERISQIQTELNMPVLLGRVTGN